MYNYIMIVLTVQLLSETLDKQKRCEELTQHEIELRGQVSWW